MFSCVCISFFPKQLFRNYFDLSKSQQTLKQFVSYIIIMQHIDIQQPFPNKIGISKNTF